MEIINVGEFKAHFSELLKRVQSGEEIGIAYGRNKVVVAKLVPRHSVKRKRRKLGILEKKAKVEFKPDFSMTEGEFLGL